MVPWSGSSFAKHNKSLGKRQLKVAAAAANRVLAESGNEGKAVRIGNWAGNRAGKSARKVIRPGPATRTRRG